MEGNEIREMKLDEKTKEEGVKPTIKERIKGCASTVWGGVKGAAKWVKDNKNDLALVGSAAAIVFGYAKTRRGGYSRYNRDEDRDYRVYDPRTGQYYYLKRRMNNREKMELDYRLENGERMGFILDDMNLLRRY